MTSAEDTLLRVGEVALLLKTSRWTVRRLIRQGSLPAVRIGHEWRVQPRALKRFLARATSKVKRNLS